MGTLGNSLQPGAVKHLFVVQKPARKDTSFHTDFDTAEISGHLKGPADDGLGCARGFAVAMLCNASLVMIVAAGWEVWRLLR